MSEEKIASIIRDFRATGKQDMEKRLSFLTEDVVWTNNEGTFKGKDEVKRYWTWEAQRVSDARVRPTGVGIMVKGNVAVQEYIFEGAPSEGRRFGEIPVIIVEEFSGDKIQRHREYFDRLSMAKQGANGWFEKMIVGQIVDRIEKGLH